MDIGGQLLRAMCAEQDVYAFIKARLNETYFFEKEEKAAFDYVQQHVMNYHVLPKVETLVSNFPTVPKAIEPANYYLDKLEERFTLKTLNNTLYACNDLIKNKNTTKALSEMEGAISQVHACQMRQSMVEFGNDAYNIAMGEYAKAGSVYYEGVHFGWPYLDTQGGMMPGDVISYVGRPAAGKTYKMLYTAHHAWHHQKLNALFLSMEMGIVPLVQRLSAMHTHLAISDIKQGNLTTLATAGATKDKLSSKLLELQNEDAKLWIVDGNLTSTPDEIYGLASHFKPHVVFIDGAYLLRSTNSRLDRYNRVADNIEQIKKHSGHLKIPTACSYQLNRQAAEKQQKKKPEEAGLENIGYSDAIGQISSIVLGLLEQDSIETAFRRKVSVLKGREGMTGQFYVNWDFQHMDFSQVPGEEELGLLQY